MNDLPEEIDPQPAQSKPQTEPLRQLVPEDVLAGRVPYVSKAGRVLSPGHARAIANLRRTRPGEHTNGGRPKGRSSITEAIGRKLAGRVRDLYAKEQLRGVNIAKRVLNKEVAEAVADVILKETLKGNFTFIREVLDRTDGTVAQRLAGHDGGPLPEPKLSRTQINAILADPEAACAMAKLADRLFVMSGGVKEFRESAHPDDFTPNDTIVNSPGSKQ